MVCFALSRRCCPCCHSSNWGGLPCPRCGAHACAPNLNASAPCLLADDQWAWVPGDLASKYFTAGADSDCLAQSNASKAVMPVHKPPVRKPMRSGASPGGRDAGEGVRRPTWSTAALGKLYNGEGLLTLRLLHQRVPIDVAPAALRFNPPKSHTVVNASAFGSVSTVPSLPCHAKPCANSSVPSFTCGHDVLPYR